MLAVQKLKGLMAEQDVSGTQLAKVLGVTSVTFYSYFKHKDMPLSKAKMIADYLKIDDIKSIFFA